MAKKTFLTEVTFKISRNLQGKTGGGVSFLIKKKTLGQVFPANFAKFLRALLLWNICKQLVLNLQGVFIRLLPCGHNKLPNHP